jgi:putative transport protein
VLAGLYDVLATSPVALLFAVIGLGWFLGAVRVRGFSLGVAAVLFVGLVFGAVDPKHFILPEFVYLLGLILFVYIIGLQSGPMFFNLFRRQGLHFTLAGTLIPLVAALGAWIVGLLLATGAPVSTGLFCGALTNTPALAAAIERLRGVVAAGAADGPTVGYSIAYPLGVVGLILVMQVATRIARVDFKEEDRRARAASGLGGDDLLSRELRLANPQLVGKSFEEGRFAELTGMVFTRLKRGGVGEEILVTPELPLEAGDVLVGVGPPEAIERAVLLIGPLVGEHHERFGSDIAHRDLVVLQRKVAGTKLSELSAACGCPVVVSRIRRGGIAITPEADTTLELGDHIRAVAHARDLDRVSQVVGDPLRDLTETDFMSFSFGLILGVLLGTFPIPLPGGQTMSLGLAGGPLVVGLILGRLGRTGPIVWTMPANASLTLRQLGILLFLAGVGTRAGATFVATFEKQGLPLLLAGGLITVLSATAAILLSRRVFGFDMITTLGLVAGIHTQPAALSFANSHTGSETPNVAYAAVYPVATISKIILAQILAGL